MRGIDSIASACTPLERRRSFSSGLVSGARNPIRIWPLRSLATSSSDGTATRTITSAPYGSPIAAPASVYSESGSSAGSPAPASTVTSWPAPVSLRTTSGTSATRRSPSAVSLGTPILIGRRGNLSAARPWVSLDPRDRPDPAGQCDHGLGRGDHAAAGIVGRELERAVAAL